MALDRQIARLAKILVDSENISFPEAQTRLRALTLEIVVGPDAESPAAHAAVLTAVSVGHRTFVGGVRVSGAIDQPLDSALPLNGSSLGEAAAEVGASGFKGAPSRRIIIGAGGAPDPAWSVESWWDGWRAGTAGPGERACGDSDNPLAGIAAGALAVGKAFQAERGQAHDLCSEIDLWPAAGEAEPAPSFAEIFLPGAVWLICLGNLGQAFLWALTALPYAGPNEVSLVLQDRDKISEENWATSVLVSDETYGKLKTMIGEAWATSKGFEVRRIDRHLVAVDRLEDDDPRVALSGVDKIEARKLMAQVGFDCIVDAGLGRTAHEFDRYRVNVFDSIRPIDKHFADQDDAPVQETIPEEAPYQRLLDEVGRCGAAELAGASVAAPHVSALAAAVAVSRLIAVCSGCKCPQSEVGRISALKSRRIAPVVKIDARGARHAGRPRRDTSAGRRR
jgi:hypothetical protein